MYLSKLELNPRSQQARRDLASPYELHRTLVRAFPTPEGEDYRARHGVLFRVEPMAHPGARPTVLVQSATAPAWQELADDYLRTESACKPLDSTFEMGQLLSFRLVANPTKKVKREGRRQGNRVALPDVATADEPTPAQQWLTRKGELAGFEVIGVASEGFYLNNSRSQGAGGVSYQAKQQLPLYGVRFDGLLRVSDPVLLRQAVQQGIGSAKAFGFGLLSLGKTQR